MKDITEALDPTGDVPVRAFGAIGAMTAAKRNPLWWKPQEKHHVAPHELLEKQQKAADKRKGRKR